MGGIYGVNGLTLSLRSRVCRGREGGTEGGGGVEMMMKFLKCVNIVIFAELSRPGEEKYRCKFILC